MYGRFGARSTQAHVQGLLEFLEEGAVSHIAVAVNNDPKRKVSLTIVGDWFSSEAVSSRETANLREAMFTRNAATVRRQLREFDLEFDRLLKARNWTVKNSCAKAAKYLKEYLDQGNAGND